MFGALKVGDVYADVGARFDDRGFDRYDRRIEESRRKSTRPVRQKLEGDLDRRAFAAYEREVDRARRHGSHERALRAKLGADFDDRGFRAYTQELDRAESGNRRFRRSTGDAESGLVNLASRIPLVKWGLIAAGAAAAAPALISLAGALGPVTGLLGAIPGLAIGAGGALATAFLGLGGIGKALGDAWDAQNQASIDGAKSAKTQEASLEQVKTAEQGLGDAQRESGQAQQDLNEARRQGARDMEDLRLAVAKGRVEEEASRIALRKARAELVQVERDPSASEAQIREARNNVDQAIIGLREARVERRRSREDLNRTKGDVDRLPDVVDARKRLADADRQVERASDDVAHALRQQSEGMDQATGAAGTLQKSMAGLSPAGQRFVTWAQGRLFPLFRRLRSSAQEGLLPGIQRGTESALRNFPVVEKAVDRLSRAMGNAAERQGRFLGRKDVGRDLGEIFGQSERLIERSAVASTHWEKGLLNVAVAARPLTKWLGDINVELSEAFEKWTATGRESGKLESFFERTTKNTELAVKTLWDFGAGLINIGGAARRAWGQDLLENMSQAAEAFRAWTESKKGQHELEGFFERWRKRWEAVGDAIGTFTRRYRELRDEGKSTNEALAISLTESFSKAIPFIIKEVAERSPDIASALVQGFLAANVWGKLFIAGWFAKRLGGGYAVRKIGEGFATNFGDGFVARGNRLGGRFKDAIKRLFGRQSERAAENAGADVAGSFAGDLVSGLRRRAGRVRDAISRQMLRGRLIGAAAVDAAAAVAGEYASSLAAGIRNRAGRVRDVIRRRLLGGAAVGGAADGAGAAVGGTFVGSIASRLRGRASSVWRAIRTRILGGAAAGGAAAGAGEAIAAEYASTISGKKGVKSPANEGRFKGAGKWIGRAIMLGVVLGMIALLPTVWKDLKEMFENSLFPKIGKSIGGFFKNLPGKTWEHLTGRDQGTRQAGGDVQPGQPYHVGETGMETFVPDVPGTIIPAGPTAQARAQPRVAGGMAGFGFASSLEQDRRKATKPLKEIRSDLKRLEADSRRSGRRTGEGITDPLERAGKDAKKTARRLRRDVGDELDDLERDSTRSSRRMADRFGDRLESIQDTGNRTTRRLAKWFDDRFGAMGKDVDRSTSRMARRTESRMGAMRDDVDHASRAMRSSVRRSMGSADDATYTGMTYISDAVAKGLKSFDAKPVHLNVPKPKGLYTGGIPNRAGSARDDHVLVGPDGRPKALMSGTEGVINEPQMGAIDAALAIAHGVGAMPWGSLGELWSSGMRHAAGGKIRGLAQGGLVPRVAKIADRIQSMFHPDSIGGYRPEDGYGEHSTGRAIDIMIGTDQAKGNRIASWIYHNAGPLGLMWEIWRQRIRHPGGDWRAMEDRGSPTANHMDHVHAFFSPGGGGGRLSAAPAAFDVPKIKVDGTRGGLRDYVQAGLSRARKAGQRYLDDQEGANTGAAVLHGDGNVEKIFAQVAKKLSKSKVATLALGEAGYDESGMRDLSYGTGSSQGPLQLLASTAAGLHVSPHDEAAVASIFFTSGFAGKGGANKLAAEGLPAHLVAQGVQGSATASGLNYKAYEGQARGWMRRFHLNRGGMIAGGLRRFNGGGRLIGPVPPAKKSPPGARQHIHGLRNPRKLGLRRFSKDVRARLRKYRGLTTGYEGQIEDQTNLYGRREREYDLDEEVFVVDQSNREWSRRGLEKARKSGLAIVVNRGAREWSQDDYNTAVASGLGLPGGGYMTGTYLDQDALRKRVRELDGLLKIRRRILRLWDLMIKRIQQARRTVIAANKRLRGFRARLARRARRLPKGSKARKRLGDRIDAINKEIKLNRGRYKDWGGKLKEAQGGRYDAWLDFEELRRERNDLEPGARFELEQARPPAQDQPSALEQAEAAYEQLQAFQSSRADLFQQFGSNFVPAGASLFGVGDASALAAGVRFFGAFGAASTPGEVAHGPAAARGTTINQTINFRGGPADERAFPGIAAHETRAVL